MLGLILASGCVNQGKLYDELAEARDTSYESWLRMRMEGDIPVPIDQLSLESAINIALLYNKSLQSKLQEREAARGQVVAAHANILPQVTVDGGFARGTVDEDSVGITLRQPLFRGGGASAGIRAARLYTLRADEDVRYTAQLIVKQAISAYYAALLADHLCQVNRDAVASAEAHLADVRIKRENGVASKYDELRAQVDVANFRAELIRQENNLVLAKTTLLRTLGTATDATINLVDTLEHKPVEVSMESAIATAYHNRPDIMMAELHIRLQREQARVVRGSYLPEVDLTLAAGTVHKPDNGRGWDDMNKVGVQFNWPVFDGLGREGALIVERARLRQREIELADVEEDVFLDVQQALLNLKNADEYVVSQELNLEHAQEGLRLTMTGYREGVNTEVEIADARSALTEARGNYYRALYDHCMSRLALEHATGVLGQDVIQGVGVCLDNPTGIEDRWLTTVERLLRVSRNMENAKEERGEQ